MKSLLDVVLGRLVLTPLEMSQLDHELGQAVSRARLIRAVLSHARLGGDVAAQAAGPAPTTPKTALTPAPKPKSAPPEKNGHQPATRVFVPPADVPWRGGLTARQGLAGALANSPVPMSAAALAEKLGPAWKSKQAAIQMTRHPWFVKDSDGKWSLTAEGRAAAPVGVVAAPPASPSALQPRPTPPEHDERRRARARQLAEDVVALGTTSRVVSTLKSSWTREALEALVGECPDWFRLPGEGAEVSITGRGLVELLGRK